MPSVMKKTWRQVDTRGLGSNDAGNDEDGGQQFCKWNKKTNLFYFDVGWEVLMITGTATLWIQWEKLKII